MFVSDLFLPGPGGGGGGTTLYKLYRYAPPLGRVFTPFWSENRYALYPF